MYYSSIGLLAIIIHCIINYEVLRHGYKKEDPIVSKSYYSFIVSIILYHISDVFWGLLYEHQLLILCFIDTVFYFIMHGISLLLWNLYVCSYLGISGRNRNILVSFGKFFFGIELVFLCFNFFFPIFFYFDKGVYVTGKFRNIIFVVQVIYMIMVSFLAYFYSRKKEGNWKRFYIVSLSSLILTIGVCLQYFYPLLPFYSAGSLISSCFLHIFVLEDEKIESLRLLYEAQEEQHRQEIALELEKKRSLTDPLTHVKNKLAFVEEEERVNHVVSENKDYHYGIGVFDLSGLKIINDTYGHQAGDIFIQKGCSLICKTFKHSKVFRVGGDEFAVVLENDDYKNRNRLMKKFKEINIKNLENNDVVVSAGMAIYDSKEDNFFDDVFNKADAEMYKNKKQLEEIGALKRGDKIVKRK